MIPRNASLENTHIVRRTPFPNDLPKPLPHLTPQHRTPILRHPHLVQVDLIGRMRASAIVRSDAVFDSSQRSLRRTVGRLDRRRAPTAMRPRRVLRPDRSTAPYTAGHSQFAGARIAIRAARLRARQTGDERS